MLSYIAEHGEIQSLRSLGPDEQAAGWEAFWSRWDPDLRTGWNEARIEFFRRVRYAEHRFRGYGPGWRSDMGRIYIEYGPPDQVESIGHQSDTAAAEVRTCTRPRRKSRFEDRHGLGRFVLVSPAFE